MIYNEKFLLIEQNSEFILLDQQLTVTKNLDIIMNMHYNKQTIGLFIKNQNRVHLELRSTETFDRIWSIQIDVKYSFLFIEL
jgi:hypothetical protein